jgi:GMP synthase-like glutamine amidotransferase
MRVLVFRHVPFEHLGLIAPALEANGIQWEYVDLFRNPDAPFSLDSAAGVISMGGPMSANDDLSYLRRELRSIEEAVGSGTPVLGVCLGAQMIAKALGAKVYRNEVREIGWAPVYWTDAARQDAVFGGLTQPETVLHWHGETFDMPSGAEWLAWSDACRNQAFRVGSGVYGLQFHLEVTPEMVKEWCAEDPGAGPIDPCENASRLSELAGMIFGRWAKIVR